MSVRIETRWTDDDGESPGRFHVVMNGQDCGPSVPCTAGAWLLTEERLQKTLQAVADKAYSNGMSDLQKRIRNAIGA
jgi:hypothetical protein